MRQQLLYALSALLIAWLGCGEAATDKKNNNETATTSKDTSVVAILQEAYIYGLPLVVMDITRRQITDPAAGDLYTPPNRFLHKADFPDAKFKTVVRPNADTYYSIAWLDLRQQPMILSLPDTKGRYYMMPLMDAYSNVFASPGTRTTGNKAGKFLVTGPQWQGQVPAGTQHIASPTNTIWLIGRTQVNSREDGLRAVVPLQRQYQLTPLNATGTPPPPPSVASTPTPKGDPNAVVKQMPAEAYFNYLNELLAANPPPAADQPILQRLATAGIGAGKHFELTAYPEPTRRQIQSIPAQLFAKLDESQTKTGKLVNGWNMGRSVIGTYGTDYESRAVVAYFGLGANLREDAIYPSCYFDETGQPLNGAHQYVIHFDRGQTPPARAFWSLTLYDPDGYFVVNPINRYTIGDRSALQANADSSIDIYVQQKDPGKGKTANWLPAPPGDFNLLLRVYWPTEEMLTGKWIPPAVRRLHLPENK